ncbi:MAG: PriCT-2 domain-containing protein [Flammeovirgaceae bacterium]
MSIFADNAQRYFEAGYNILPLAKGGKQPIINGWQEWGKRRQPQFQIDNWINIYADCNIGLPLGEANSIIALDFDNNVSDLHEKIISITPPSPVRKVGAKGFTAFYRYNGERNRRWKAEGKTVVELLSTGTQTVLPYSIHPDTGKPYIWLTEDTLLDYSVDDLPQLTKDFIDKIDELFGIKRKIIEYSTNQAADIELDSIKNALQFIPANEYSTWIEIGMALNHTYGDSAFNVWDSWSASATNYDGSKMDYKWRSFGAYQGAKLTAATILHYAINNGWLPPRLLNDDAVIVVGEKSKKKPLVVSNSINVAKKDITQGLPDYLLNAPNLIGELINWIESCAIRQQPALAMAASLGAVGTVMAHRFRTPSDLRSNMMTLGICGSGMGKDHARKCISMLFNEVGMGEKLLGDFASDTAVISALHSRAGIGFAMTDEVGDALAAMSSKNAGSYEARILRITKELFSSSNTVYLGKEYANHDGKMEAKRINQPCLSVYGTSTEKQFYDALNGDKILDGFLPRWLIFEGNGHSPKSQVVNGAINAPDSLIEAFRTIYDINPAGDSPSLVVGRIKPRTVDISQGAWDKFNQLENYAEEMRLREYDKKSGLDALYARIPEHAYKLALIAHGEGGINASVAAWACELIMYLSQRMVTIACENIGNNDYERDLMAVLKFISLHESGINKRPIIRKFQRIALQDLNKILHHLSESGSIEVEEVTAKVNNKPTLVFHAI